MSSPRALIAVLALVAVASVAAFFAFGGGDDVAPAGVVQPPATPAPTNGTAPALTPAEVEQMRTVLAQTGATEAEVEASVERQRVLSDASAVKSHIKDVVNDIEMCGATAGDGAYTNCDSVDAGSATVTILRPDAYRVEETTSTQPAVTFVETHDGPLTKTCAPAGVDPCETGSWG